MLLPCDKRGILVAGSLVFTWIALGFPLRWSKRRGGTEFEWIGFWADLWGGRLGISPKRASWLTNWMKGQAAAGRVEMSDFTAVLGRLSFSTGPLDFLKPFIAPLHA